MLHTCVEKFDVIDRRENILGWDRKVIKAIVVFSYVFGWQAANQPKTAEIWTTSLGSEKQGNGF
jgi:hypothetical protein